MKTAIAARSVTLRRVVAADAEAMQRFVVALSPASRRWRFHGCVSGCTPHLLTELTQVDGVSHVAFVASTAGEIVGEARYVVTADGDGAEFAIAVADRCQGQGVAAALMAELARAARGAGVASLYGDVLQGNGRMVGFMRRQGFENHTAEWADTEPGVQRWCRSSQAPGAAPARGRWRARLWGGLLARVADRVVPGL